MKLKQWELHQKQLIIQHGRVRCIPSFVSKTEQSFFKKQSERLTRPSSLHGEPEKNSLQSPDHFLYPISHHKEGDLQRSGSPPSIYNKIGVDYIE